MPVEVRFSKQDDFWLSPRRARAHEGRHWRADAHAVRRPCACSHSVPCAWFTFMVYGSEAVVRAFFLAVRAVMQSGAGPHAIGIAH